MSTESELAHAAVLAAAPLAQLVADIAGGRVKGPSDIAKSLVGFGLSLVPRSELIGYVTADGITTAELAADVAENLKFGGEDGQ